MSSPEAKRRLRILVVEPAGNLWGSERVLLDFLSRAQRHDYAVACPPRCPMADHIEPGKAIVHSVPLALLHEKGKLARLRAAGELLRVARRSHPDVIYLNQAGCYRIGALVASMIRCPIVAHVRISEDAPHLAHCRPSGKRLARLISISPWITEQLREHAFLDRIPIDTIYDGFSPAHQALPLDDVRDAEPPLRLACLGRVHPIKGQDILLDALAIWKAQGGRFHCRIIGSGTDFFEEQRNRTIALGLGAEVEWTGFCQDPFPLLAGSDFLVVPSRTEPLGRVLFEGWSAACVPVVFRGSGGAASAVAESGGGLLYESPTGDSLARCLGTLSTLNKGDRRERVRLGREWMERHTAPDRYATRIETVFSEVAASFR